jgi:oligopeptide/dipeptide ABC transporter ATP-binding protein
LLITHNLGIVAELADRAAVMYAGQIVETGPADALLSKPLHPYTRALLDAIPALDNDGARLKPIPGNVPQLGAWPAGCRFHPRCSQRRPECSLRTFDLAQTNPARWVRCPFSQATSMTAPLNESPAPA